MGSISKRVIINIEIWFLIALVPLVRLLLTETVCGVIGIMLDGLCLCGLCYVWTITQDGINTPRSKLSSNDSYDKTNLEFSADIIEILELPEIKHL